MRRYATLLGLASLLVLAVKASGRELPAWKPRLAVTGTASVWSPGGADGDLFQTSMGAGLSVMYWPSQRTQWLLRGTYVSLKGQPDYWRDAWSDELQELADTTLGQDFDVFDVTGSLWTLSLELRRLYPGDYANYLYLGIGADVYYFGDIEGDYEVYVAGPTIKGTLTDQRKASFAAGPHISPGMFFILYRHVFVDAGVRVHFLYDGEENPFWLEPFFAASWRIF